MSEFTCIWSTPNGKFGWTTIDECSSLEEAAAAFFEERARAADIPADADLDSVRPGTSPFPMSLRP
jgi:hypothetical protein